MPVYAFLKHRDLPCPLCAAPLWCEYERKPCYITFQWGYCETRYGYESAYQVGETIYWRPCRDGVVRGWTSFRGESFNVGDPLLPSIIVTDVGTDAAHFPQACQACGGRLGGAALHIRGNTIAAAWAFTPELLRSNIPAVYLTVTPGGEIHLLPEAEAEPWQLVHHYVEQQDGTWLPMPEWELRGNDHEET